MKPGVPPPPPIPIMVCIEVRSRVVTYVKNLFSVLGNVLQAPGRAWATVWIVVQSRWVQRLQVYRITAVLLSARDTVIQWFCTNIAGPTLCCTFITSSNVALGESGCQHLKVVKCRPEVLDSASRKLLCTNTSALC